MKKFKRFSALALSIILIISVFGMTECAGEKKDYTEIFEKDSVIDINIDIDEADLNDIRNYPKNEEYHSADITVDGIKVENAGIRTKGNMTLNSVANSDSDRYSYRIKFNKYVKGNKLLGLDELCLNNGYSDPSYMREYLHYEVLRSLGMNVPETVFARVYINGEYAGLYLAVEGIDDTFLEDNFGEAYKDGNLYKMDEGSTLEYKENEDYSYADLKSGDDENLDDFKKFVKKLNDMTDGEKGDIEDILDVDSALKYIASNTVLCNYDSYNGNMHHNYYLYENENGVFTVIPWDFNMSFGGFNGSNSDVGIDTPYISGSLETLPLIGKLLSVPEYKERYYSYIKEIMSYLENFENRVNELKTILAPYVKEDSTAFYSYEEFEKATTKQETSAQQNKETITATDDTAKNEKGGKGFGGSGGGSSSIINCVADRLANLTKQFSGEAEKTTAASENGRGPGDRRGQKPDNQNGQPPEMPQGGQGMNGQNGQPPEMPQGGQGMDGQNGQPPEMPQGGQGMNGQNGQPPEMPQGGQGMNGQNGQPPEMPQGGQGMDGQNGQPPEMPQGGQGMNGQNGQPPEMPQGGQNMERTMDNNGKNNEKSADNSVIRVHVNGHLLKFDSEPYMKNDSVFVGFRAILEALGAEVSWNQETNTVTAVKDGTEVSFTIGSDTAYVNGEECKLPSEAELTNDSAMIPVRFISEKLGMKVSWEESGKLVVITSK